MSRVAACGCGAVRVSVEGDPQICWVCHCDHCQRLSGSIGLFAAVFRDEDVTAIEGQTTTYQGNQEKWPGAERYFCSECGTSVHWVNPAAFPGMRLIATGCFSDPEFPGPNLAMQTKYRHRWCGDFDGADAFEEYPPSSDPVSVALGPEQPSNKPLQRTWQRCADIARGRIAESQPFRAVVQGCATPLNADPLGGKTMADRGVLDHLREANRRERRHAPFFGWHDRTADGKALAEVGVLQSLTEAMSHRGAPEFFDLRPSGDVWPDCEARDCRGDLVAVEVTELVDRSAFQRGTPRVWSTHEVVEGVAERLADKDAKAFHGTRYTEVVALIHTDEFYLNPDETSELLQQHSFELIHGNLTRAFVLFSYWPSHGHCPYVELRLAA